MTGDMWIESVSEGLSPPCEGETVTDGVWLRTRGGNSEGVTLPWGCLPRVCTWLRERVLKTDFTQDVLTPFSGLYMEYQPVEVRTDGEFLGFMHRKHVVWIYHQNTADLLHWLVSVLPTKEKEEYDRWSKSLTV